MVVTFLFLFLSFIITLPNVLFLLIVTLTYDYCIHINNIDITLFRLFYSCHLTKVWCVTKRLMPRLFVNFRFDYYLSVGASIMDKK